ncbi:hypothetical protein [Georgenia wangjunii]|uniref:hypothetical protein n=1 Tax=Georgenia wangjunii TaxID=3117730 RepID=UPI002F25F1A2
MASRTFPRGARALAGVALAGAALAGCSANPGAAAVVDGERISEAFLSEAVRDFELVTGQPTSAAAMISTLAVMPPILAVAEEAGIAVSTEQGAQLLDAQIEQAGGTPPAEGYGEGVIQIAQMTLVNQQIQTSPDAMMISEEIARRVSEADIELNPRYGELTADGQLTAPSYPWLVAPEPEEGFPVPQG